MEPNDTGGGSPEYIFSSDDESVPVQTTVLTDQTHDMEVMEITENDKAPPLLTGVGIEAQTSSAPLEDNPIHPIVQNTLHLSQKPMDTNFGSQASLNQSPACSSSSRLSSNPATPRAKAYPPGSKGPFLVFFRPKANGKPLNKLQIEKDLSKSFRGILEVDSPSRDKLRVTVSDRDQANKIAAFELFSMEYKVYIPSHEVECYGVVTEHNLSRADIMSGAGGFKNRAVPLVPVLDASQMNKAYPDGSKKPSNSFRVTFSGSALPSALVIGRLRLPVRLYVPTVMHCEKCRQLGHTALYCSNKPRCSKCGDQHAEGSCKTEPKCTTCGQAFHELTACPKYIEREKHTINSLKQRSRRSYADMLKKIAPTVAPSAHSNTSNNIFTSLPDNDQGSDSEGGEEYTVIETGTKRKRAVAKRHSQKHALHNVPGQQTLQSPLVKLRSDGKSKKAPPGFKFSAGDFPALPGTSKTPVVPISRPENHQTRQQEQNDVSGKLTLSGIVDIIFETLEISPATRQLITMALSLVKPFLKQLASKWPILESFISFDG